MNDFKKNFKKPGGFKPGGFSRPSFGGPSRGRDFNGPSETYKATCSKCNSACEVPFRPNGKKPVFCKNCFVRDDARPAGNTYEKRGYAPERSFAPKPMAPVEDPRIAALQKELAIVHGKLDTLIENLESAAYSSILTKSAAREEKPKAEKAAPAKKKAAPKKK